MWRERVENLFREKTAKEWEDAIAETGGACTVCKTVDEWMVHEHALAAGMVVEVDDAEHGRMKQPGAPTRLRGTPGPAPRRAPTLGEHTESALAEIRAAPPGQRFESHEDILSALQGVRVLDLCIVLAGPTCGRTLGEFGADVIKIDDPNRPYDFGGNLDVNRGKRSIQIDLKKPEGRDVFWKLLETADVVVENNRKGAMDRMGLGYEEISKRKPDIVYASTNAFGYDGPWAERPGWEQLAQATTGIQVRRGGRDDAPQLLPYPMNDYGTGLLGAFSIALALHERNRTGRGQSVDGGLSLTACLLQSPYFLDYEGHQRNDPEGLNVRGLSALSRLYEADDGWFYLQCADDRSWAALTGLPELAHLSSDSRFADAQAREQNDAELAGELSHVFAKGTRGGWVRSLTGAGVSAMENLAVPDYHDDPNVREAGLIVSRDHPGMGTADHLGVVARLSGTPARLGRPTPVLGAETDEILAEAGYSTAEIAALKAAGAVVQVGE